MKKTPETSPTTRTNEPFFKRFLRAPAPLKSGLRAGRACVGTTDTCGSDGGTDGCNYGC